MQFEWVIVDDKCTRRQNELYSEVLKLFSERSTGLPAPLPRVILPRQARVTCKKPIVQLILSLCTLSHTWTWMDLVLNFLSGYFAFSSKCRMVLLEWLDPSVAEESDLVVPAGDGPGPARRRALLRLLVDEQVLTHAETLYGNKL